MFVDVPFFVIICVRSSMLETLCMGKVIVPTVGSFSVAYDHATLTSYVPDRSMLFMQTLDLD